MEVSISIFVVMYTVCFIGWMVINWVWIRPKKLEKILRNQGFKGNSYRILYGDTEEKTKMVKQVWSKPMPDFTSDNHSYVHPFSNQIIKKYGKNCFTWNGPVPVVEIAEPGLMREIFKRLDDFKSPRVNPFLRIVGSGVTLSQGEKWAKHRKVLNPTFYMDKLKLMHRAVNETTNEMISEWETLVSKTGSCEIDARLHLNKLTADVISRSAFGSNYEEGREVFKLLGELFVIVFSVANSIYIPGWRFVPTKTNRRINYLDNTIKSFIKDIIISKRKKLKQSGESPQEDFLDLLLESNNVDENAKKKKNNVSLSFNEVIEQCKEFYTVGQESTATLLGWLLILLGKHQDWQHKAREEVLRIFGTKDPDFDGISKLKTMDMIVQEVLRLYAPVSELFRTVDHDVKIGDYALPAGVAIKLPLLQVQQDKDIWGEDATEFKPERFNKGISNASGGDMSFFAFGYGPRTCLGINFTLIEAKMVLAMILQHFSFELSPSYTHSPITHGTLHPQFGAQIILKRLST